MSSGLILEALEAVVDRRVVGLVVLPAAPDDLIPGGSEDAFGVGMAFTGESVFSVAVLGPLVRQA